MLLNRRHLRIKVLHSSYAFHQSGGEDFGIKEKELTKSIEKMYDLYVSYLSIFDEVCEFAKNKIEEAKNKHLPTEADLNPNLKFVENKALMFFTENRDLIREIEERKISWADDKDMISKIYASIKNSEEYNIYMDDSSTNIEDDKLFIVSIFKKYIANFDVLLNHFEEQSIFYSDDIDLVCSMVIKTIKLIDEDSDEFSKILPLYKDEKDETNFYKTLFRKSIKRDEEIAKIISTKTDNWELDRIAKIDVLLMKLAITEAIEFPNIPLKVTMNEYIELSKFYSTPKSSNFINGILDRILTELKTNGKIKKVGRGLIE